MAAKKDVAYEASQVNVPDQASTRDAGIGTNRDAGPDCMQSLPQPSKQVTIFIQMSRTYQVSAIALTLWLAPLESDR